MRNRYPLDNDGPVLSTRLDQLTWQEIETSVKKNAVAIFPIGATEAHGPHLPLGTDVIIAEAMADCGAQSLERVGIPSLIFPAFAYTVADFAAGFCGTVSIREQTLVSLLVDCGISAIRHGFRRLLFANAHLDPSHIRAIETAVTQLRTCHNDVDVLFPDVTKRPYALWLGDEFKSGACHAGQYEGSIVMEAAPELVRESIRQELPANPKSLSKAIREGKTDFVEAGGPLAYFGFPAQASRLEGKQHIQTLGQIIVHAITGKSPEEKVATASP